MTQHLNPPIQVIDLTEAPPFDLVDALLTFDAPHPELVLIILEQVATVKEYRRAVRLAKRCTPREQLVFVDALREARVRLGVR